jgi:predicted ATPase
MLNQLGLENFKSWRSVRQLRMAPITGLFGTNSSGKTSIIQALLMMKQTVESSDRKQVLNLGDDSDPVRLGTFREILHQGKGPFEFDLKWTLPHELVIPDPAQPGATLFCGAEMDFRTRISAAGGKGRMRVEELEYRFADATIAMRRKEREEHGYELDGSSERGFGFKRIRGRAWDLPDPVKSYGFPDQAKAYYQNASFVSDLALAFEEQMNRVYYLGPLRDYPKREYTWAGAEPADMGQRGERVVDALMASQERPKISRGKGVKAFTVQEYVGYWLKELGLVHGFSVQPITPDSNLYRVWITRGPGAAPALITDVGFGISQILPVLTICYYVPEGSTILLEQPEIHLHPAVQSGLADVFIDVIKRRKIQLVVESHSEHLLRRLQRRMAEEQIAPEHVALYFARDERGVSRLSPLEVDEFGNIRNWPPNFFGDEMGDLAAMAEAAMRRQIARRGAA